MEQWLVRDVELGDRFFSPEAGCDGYEGPRVDVRLAGGLVTEVAPAGTLNAAPDEGVLDGHGGALLPGLHDHHLHLNAMAAVRRSVPIGPDDVDSPGELGRVLRESVEQGRLDGGWVRAVGYHESVAGDLDRAALDAWLPTTPVRVQHRSGALWILNSAALALVRDHLDGSADVERDSRGDPNGRLWRYDQRLAPALPDTSDSHRRTLEDLSTDLLALGITGATDATPDLGAEAVGLLAHTAPLRLHLLGVDDSTALPARATRGPRKVLLRDHDLPPYDALLALLDPTGVGPSRRPVAVHCVTRESAVLVTAALSDLGGVDGDRIEHGAVIPPELDDAVRHLGCAVVTQPDFLRTRGDAYARDVDPDDLPHLYRWASLEQAGVPVVASSDAPYGEVDPWQVVRSARDRRTTAGQVLGHAEHVSSGVALRGYLTSADSPAGPVRTVAPGGPADLVLLHVSLHDALADPDSDAVRTTWAGGSFVPDA